MDPSNVGRPSIDDGRRVTTHGRPANRGGIHLVSSQVRQVQMLTHLTVCSCDVLSPHTWLLKFNPAFVNDSGTYVCQVSTDPPLVRYFHFQVSGKQPFVNESIYDKLRMLFRKRLSRQCCTLPASSGYFECQVETHDLSDQASNPKSVLLSARFQTWQSVKKRACAISRNCCSHSVTILLQRVEQPRSFVFYLFLFLRCRMFRVRQSRLNR